MNWLRILCAVGIHWRGRKGLGSMYNANSCSICGDDAPGLIVIREEKTPKPSGTNEQGLTLIELLVVVIALLIIVIALLSR